jgi:hypothetical protein
MRISRISDIYARSVRQDGCHEEILEFVGGNIQVHVLMLPKAGCFRYRLDDLVREEIPVAFPPILPNSGGQTIQESSRKNRYRQVFSRRFQWFGIIVKNFLPIRQQASFRRFARIDGFNPFRYCNSAWIYP